MYIYIICGKKKLKFVNYTFLDSNFNFSLSETCLSILTRFYLLQYLLCIWLDRSFTLQHTDLPKLHPFPSVFLPVPNPLGGQNEVRGLHGRGGSGQAANLRPFIRHTEEVH